MTNSERKFELKKEFSYLLLFEKFFYTLFPEFLKKSCIISCCNCQDNSPCFTTSLLSHGLL
ncbi:hypothetical protein T02_8114 [Trichinella nativa]|uniref:Uncharacterized protein n=1 Tax=Trichinella nativa TaxID=6335 RepID=A0A0V1KN59_9BILA|nr:hypothetical protein T02_8114 [Trichinella nativa]